MVKELMHDPLFLGQKSGPASKADIQTAKDLLDTLIFHKNTCVGMAANMIGVKKRIIAFDNGGIYAVMLNPEMIERSTPYETEESCLSLLGGPRKTIRYESIKVRWQSIDLKTHTAQFTGFTAQIIQHEIDHCNGVLI